MPRGVRKGPSAEEKRKMAREAFEKQMQENKKLFEVWNEDRYKHELIKINLDFLRFLDECCEFYKEFSIEVNLFMYAYACWRNNLKIKSEIHVIQRDVVLKSFGVKKFPENIYVGIRLRDDCDYHPKEKQAA